MTLTSRLTQVLMLVLALGAASLAAHGQVIQPGLFTIQDASPDLPFGAPAVGRKAGSAGRVLSLAMGPDGQTIYAAAEISGVWKSTDGAHTWKQAGHGLRSGSTAGHASLALDRNDASRLLYATGADDGRP